MSAVRPEAAIRIVGRGGSTLPRWLLYLLVNWPNCVLIPRRYPRSVTLWDAPYLNFSFAEAQKRKLQTRCLADGPNSRSRAGLFPCLVYPLKTDIRRSGGIVR
jgi:hypothetical protein